MRTNLPRAVRALRQRKGWRQVDVGARGGVSHQLISRIERGELGGITVQSLERVAMVLGATLEIRAHWNGADLDHLIDARHAAVEEAVARFLIHHGWQVRPEVSFSHYGDRGRVDLLARWPPTALVLVIEVWSQIGDIQDTLGRLHTKQRLAGVMAKDLGWTVSAVVPAVVVADSAAARKAITAHSSLFSGYSLRGRKALAWLRHPVGSAPNGLLWFANASDARGVRVNRAKRVKKGPDSRPT
jgi:transcriptional regulator with XRE-family HTH domain